MEKAINKLKLEVKILQGLNSDVAERITSYEKAINVLEIYDENEIFCENAHSTCIHQFYDKCNLNDKCTSQKING